MSLNSNKYFKKQNKLLPAILVSLILILLVLTKIILFPSQKENDEKNILKVKKTIIYPEAELAREIAGSVLNAHNIKHYVQERNERLGDLLYAHVSTDFSLPEVHLAVQQALDTIGVSILSAHSEPASGQLLLNMGYADSVFFRLRFIRVQVHSRRAGRIALIIDDFGDHWDNVVKSFADFEIPLTVSVIPGREYSTKVAHEMRSRGKEIIIHLPMEPMRGSYTDPNFYIRITSMPDQIKKIIDESIREVPHAVGISNHMGSRLTSDRQSITRVLEAVKPHNLYFVDSRTISSTVAFEAAKSLSIPCGRRDVFIDAENEASFISSQIDQLASIARSRGSAIGIGHVRKLTLDILNKKIPQLQESGFEFVLVSQIIQ